MPEGLLVVGTDEGAAAAAVEAAGEAAGEAAVLRHSQW